MNQVKKILADIGYPIDVLVFDFESFYDKDYTLKKLTMLEYVKDPRFELMGMAGKCNDGKTGYATPLEIKQRFPGTQKHCGNNLERLTLVGHNLMFDCLILKEHFGICPSYCIDILNLARYQEARAEGSKARSTNSLAACAERYGLNPKGEISYAEGKHWTDLTPGQRKEYAAYSCNDVDITSGLLEVLLPLLPNPKDELMIGNDILHRFLNPVLEFDFEKAEQLMAAMQEKVNEAVEKVNL